MVHELILKKAMMKGEKSSLMNSLMMALKSLGKEIHSLVRDLEE